MTQFIFITGGVVSSLGKGVAAASLGALLESRGIKITLMKLDPYINVDPGTMNPFQHGEVFVTEDGAETDLDLGHYERFTNCRMQKKNNFTTGQVYDNVIKKERRGEYQGKTVQVIPHITDEIKHNICKGSSGVEVAIVEIGGTVGDIESLPFLEAIRQMGIEEGKDNVCYIHLTLIPRIATIDELKTKPTQHSVKELRGIGIQPDILICRTSQIISQADREKIALFTNVPVRAVISAVDVDLIYKVPHALHQQGLDDIVCEKLNIKSPKADIRVWDEIIEKSLHPQYKVNIAFVGKYVGLTESYKSLTEAIHHAQIHTHAQVKIHYIDSEEIEKNGTSVLQKMDAILVPGGFGKRGIEGKIKAIQFARENKKPYLGICLGMQLAVVEFARHVAKLDLANSTEFNPQTPHPVIAQMTEWQSQTGEIEKRDHSAQLGGTMRLGAQTFPTLKNTLANQIYGEQITERHRHRYEVNNDYLDQLEKQGLIVSARTKTDQLCEMIELLEAVHPWFTACQFHPEFTSNPRTGHPLFNAFLRATIQQKL